jgi:hypothetical protein
MAPGRWPGTFDGENRRLLHIPCAWTGFAMKLRHKVAAGFSLFVLGLSVWLAWVWLTHGRHEILIILLLIVVVLTYLPKIYLTISNPGDFRRIWFRRPEPKLSESSPKSGKPFAASPSATVLDCLKGTQAILARTGQC